MRFIKLELKARFKAIEYLLDQAEEMRRKGDYLRFILIVLWAIACTVLGIFLFPITIILSAIAWHSDLDGMEAEVNELFEDYTESEN